MLAVVGSALPMSLRAFLLTLAVVDDLIVIVIIAVFFTEHLHYASLGVAGLCLVAWAVAQRLRLSTPVLYIPLAVAAWWFTHESGVHATIAGVVLGLLTRVRRDPDEAASPAEHLEHVLEPISSTVAVPFFALMAAGVVIGGGDLLRDPVVIGVALGLLIGKPLGIFGGSYLVARFTHAELSPDLTWRDIGGVAVLAGIGFTVSLLVSDLSFDVEAQVVAAKTAVLVASAVSAVVGGLLLYHRGRSRAAAQR